MWKLHATRLSALAALSVALGSCAAGPEAEAPIGLTLAGNWRLDHALSDDPQKVIGKMQAEAQKILRRQARIQDALAGQANAGGRTPDVNPNLGGDDPAAGGTHAGRRPDPLQYSPMMHALAEVLARGDYLTVRQSTAEVAFDFGTTQRSYTPGAKSVVSAGSGVADQTSGWSGRGYVINIRAQLGPSVVETYTLSADGTRLTDKVHIGPAELPAVELTRVYDRSAEAAPRAPPSTG